MGTCLVLVHVAVLSTIPPHHPVPMHWRQDLVAFEQQRLAVEHHHTVGAWQTQAGRPAVPDDGLASANAIGQARLYDLAIHPSTVGRAGARHQVMRVPAAGVDQPPRPPHPTYHDSHGHKRMPGYETPSKAPRPAPRRRLVPPAGLKRVDPHHPEPHPATAPPRQTRKGSLSQARERISHLRALVAEAERRDLSDVAHWLRHEADRLAQRVQMLEERRELRDRLGHQHNHLTHELERVRRMEHLLKEIGKAEKAGDEQWARALSEQLRGLARRHPPYQGHLEGEVHKLREQVHTLRKDVKKLQRTD